MLVILSARIWISCSTNAFCWLDCSSIVSIKFATTSAHSSAECQDLLVATSSGTALLFGDLNLLEIEHALKQDPTHAFQSIMQNIQLQQVDVGSLDATKQSILLVRNFTESSSRSCIVGLGPVRDVRAPSIVARRRIAFNQRCVSL